MQQRDSDLAYGHFNSPVGALLIAGDGEQLHHIRFPSERRARRAPAEWRRDDAVFSDAFRQLAAYFAGELTRFDLPLRFAGTRFQNEVWAALCHIPYGETATYGALAARIGRPTASRAVGGANGANPLPIVVPCHRVIGANASLTGFGGGLPIKKFLLDHEQRVAGHRRRCAARP
ncbi:MAG: methylated-DNA--[protein]-cysteine S-methyltransferase [Kiloniellales bacterium]|nr:methylated-DNA--[protein]-cysteine S-methyltransferase [Kiloniellales bacterium]